MPGDLERPPAPAPGPGPTAVAAELTGRIRAELPAIGELEDREQVLVAAWLTGLRSARTRRAYAGDVTAWLGWLAERDTGALGGRPGTRSTCGPRLSQTSVFVGLFRS